MYLAKRFFLVTLAGLGLLAAASGMFRLWKDAGVSPSRHALPDVGIVAAGLLVMALCWGWGRRLKAAHEAALDEMRRFTDDMLQASTTPWKQVLALVFFLALAAVSWLLYLQNGDWMLALCAVVTAVFCVLLVPFSLAQYRHGKPTLRMDAHGFDHAFYGPIPWSEVHGIYLHVQRIRNIEVKRMVLGVSNPSRYLARMPWVARLFTEQLRLPKGRYGTLVVAVQGLGMDPLRIVNAAEVLRDRASPPRIPYWTPSMDHETIAQSLELAYLERNPDGLPPDEVLRRLEAVHPNFRAMSHQLSGRR